MAAHEDEADTTTTADGPAPAGEAAAAAGPGGLPTWARRLAVVAALALAVGVLVVGSRRNVVGQVDDVQKVEVITAKEPAPGAKVLRQSAIGAVLKPGYDGRLTINGTPIPEEQMEGAVDPSQVSAEDLARYGIRPNNRNRVFFTPGPGKVIEEYDTGPVTVVLTYFQDLRAETTSQTSTWTVTVD